MMTTVQRGKKMKYLFFGVLLILCLVVSFTKNFPGNTPTVKYRISFDNAQYYVYLPATFIYRWDVNQFPKGCDIVRHGFVLDLKKNKVITKTTYGVALLWTPFFLVAHFVALHWNLQPDGFSWFYERLTLIPGVFYLIIGLYFLRKFLRRYYSQLISFLAIMLVLLGTNLFFWGTDGGLMSHVNSFFLFSLYLFLLKKFLDSEKKSFRLFLGISIVFAVAILIRPTNILLLTCLIFLDVTSFRDIRNRIILFLHPKYLVTFIIVCFLIFLPQFFYWKYLTGNFVYYSYPGETFSNWSNPQILSFWFAPLNGLFLYSPLVLMFIAGIIAMIVKRVPNGIFVGIIFLFISYLFASWYCWFFGGSFGCRPVVEYYALLALPFGYFLTVISKMKNLFIRSLCILFIVVSSYYSLALTFNNYWNTSSTWAWDDFLLQLDHAGLYHFQRKSYTYINDFENPAATKIYPTNERFHSPTVAGYVNSWVENNGTYSRALGTILFRPVIKVTASLWVNQLQGMKTGAQFVCTISDKNKSVVYSRIVPIDDWIKRSDTWTKISEIIRIPGWIDQSDTITFTVRNPEKKLTLFIDDMSLKFE